MRPLKGVDNAAGQKKANPATHCGQYLPIFYLPQQLLILHPISVMRSCSIKRVRSVYAIWKCFPFEEAWRNVAVTTKHRPVLLKLLAKLFLARGRAAR